VAVAHGLDDDQTDEHGRREAEGAERWGRAQSRDQREQHGGGDEPTHVRTADVAPPDRAQRDQVQRRAEAQADGGQGVRHLGEAVPGLGDLLDGELERQRRRQYSHHQGEVQVVEGGAGQPDPLDAGASVQRMFGD
jgi:hypothetical protein